MQINLRRSKGALLIALLGAVITAFGAIVQFNNEQIASKKADSLDKENLAFRTRITHQQDRIASQQDSIGRLQTEIANQLTGGGARPEILPSPKQLSFSVVNNSKYPLRNVQVSVQDLSYMKHIDPKSPYISQKLVFRYSKAYEAGDIPPETAASLFPFMFSGETSNPEFHLLVSWLNGNYQMNIKYQRQKDGTYRFIK